MHDWRVVQRMFSQHEWRVVQRMFSKPGVARRVAMFLMTMMSNAESVMLLCDMTVSLTKVNW